MCDDTMLEHFRHIFDYVGIDFAEKAPSSDMLFSGRRTIGCMASVKPVRIYAGSEGVLVATDLREPVPRPVDAVERRLP